MKWKDVQFVLKKKVFFRFNILVIVINTLNINKHLFQNLFSIRNEKLSVIVKIIDTILLFTFNMYLIVEYHHNAPLIEMPELR